MKKITITLMAFGLLSSGLKAQTIQEGMNHLYADRFKGAIAVFEKLLATNPNNIEAIYWLGQVYFDQDENARARQLYEKALATNGSAPMILVGLGHADLHENKVADARQKFESALTASRGRKGDDPMVLTAIGRAMVDAKSGDAGYAVQKLEAAVTQNPKNTETLLQLGNAYRKANPGQGGGQAFETYKKALVADPKFAVANLRLAKLFESQKNWEFYLNYLNDAVKSDEHFSPAYYELFYYYWFLKQDYPQAEAQLNKFIESKKPDSEIQDQFLFAQLLWGKKDYATAIQKAESVYIAMGDRTKPKVFKLLADANFQKGDYANAKKYSDMYFAKEKKEDIIAFDYKLKADIISKLGATPDEILSTYMTGVEFDTVLTSKIEFLTTARKVFNEKKLRDKEVIIIEKIMSLKPKPTINDYFDLTYAYFFVPNYVKSRENALIMIGKWPEQPFGYEWAFNVSSLVDSVKKDSIAVPDALKLNDFAAKDTAKYKKQYINSVRFLGGYYINVAKDKDKSLEYFTKWLEADQVNAETIKGYIETIKKMPAKTPGTGPKPNSTSSQKLPKPKPAAPTKVKTTTTTSKKVVSKK